MSFRSVVLIGGPDSGKTNYIGRLWASFKMRKGALRAENLPEDIVFVEGAIEHLMKGSFAPRSDTNLEDSRQDFSVQVRTDGGAGSLTDLLVPDISGELWLKAVKLSELSQEWLDALERADGAVLFVRALSNQNVQPMDWVTARNMLKIRTRDEPALDAGEGDNDATIEVNPTPDLPTQVLLCELLRHLSYYLADRPDGGAPRVSIVVAAWDLVSQELRAAGPMGYLTRQFPLFAGRLEDVDRIEVRLFGLSVVGGDLENDPDFLETYHQKDLADQGWVVMEEDGEWRKNPDITLPIAWAVGG